MEGIILVGGYMTGHTNNAMRPLGHSLFEASLPLVIIKTFPTSLIYHLIEVHRRVQIAETAFIFPPPGLLPGMSVCLSFSPTFLIEPVLYADESPRARDEK